MILTNNLLRPSDLITVAEARDLLGVSHAKMSRIIKDGELRFYPNPLDRRTKLVSRGEVLFLKPDRSDVGIAA